MSAMVVIGGGEADVLSRPTTERVRRNFAGVSHLSSAYRANGVPRTRRAGLVHRHRPGYSV